MIEWDGLTDYEKLDNILKFLNRDVSKAYRNTPIAYDIIGSGFDYQPYLPEINLALKHLAEVEKLIDMDSDRIYQINFSGRMFIKEGGYKEQRKSLKNRSEWEDEMAIANRRNGERLNELTEKAICAGWAAAGGTAFLGLMELIKLIPSHHHHFHH